MNIQPNNSDDAIPDRAVRPLRYSIGESVIQVILSMSRRATEAWNFIEEQFMSTPSSSVLLSFPTLTVPSFLFFVFNA